MATSGERSESAPGQLQARPRELHRQLRPREPLQRLVQAGAGVPIPAGDADLPLGQRGDRPEIRPPLRLGDATQASGDPLRAVEIPFFEADVDQKREQRAHHGRLADRGNLILRVALGGPLEQLSRKRRIALGEAEGGERGNNIRMLLEPIQ
jgi:hypothetical protein